MNHFLAVALVPILASTRYLNALLAHIQGAPIPELFEQVRDLAGLLIGLPSFTFWFLFVFRYLRLIVHIISFWCFYRPTPIPSQPTILPRDVSVILPTVDPENHDFAECIQSCLYNHPKEIIVVTVGRNMAALTNQIVGPYRTAFPSTNIQVHFTDIANKRIQVAHGVSFATGKVTVLLDDHVFWPTGNFLPTILAPFENEKVGAVGTNKRVRRTETGFNVRSFWNMIGALYLERHNFEIRATNAIDGGVFVISGRTAAYRTSILAQPGFMAAFTNERFFFGMFGPLNADDDNFLTRQVVAQGYDIKIQYGADAMIVTTLGTYPRFLSQCLRWVRTTWRSNSASLLTDRTVWYRQPWCVYAVYLTSFVNFALFYDAALIYTLNSWADRTALHALLAWIFATKMVKLMPYFLREPQDLLMLPGYFAFAYFHSLIKLYAGLTFWVTAWGGRNLNAVHDGHDGDDSDGPDNLSWGSQTSVPARSSGSDSSNRSYSQQRLRRASRSTLTPWGIVRNDDDNDNNTTRPANVLDNHLVVTPGFSTRSRSRSRSRSLNPLATSFQTYRDPSPASPASSHAATPVITSPQLDTPVIPAASDSRVIHDINALTRAPPPFFDLGPSWLPTVQTRRPTPRPNTNTNTNTTNATNTTRRSATTTTATTTARPPFTLARERKGLGIPSTPLGKTWARGKQCRCLHSDRDKLLKTRSCRCDVEGLFQGHDAGPGPAGHHVGASR